MLSFSLHRSRDLAGSGRLAGAVLPALVSAVVTLVLVFSTPLAASAQQKLYVYTYDSFVSWGPASDFEAGFEALYPGVDVVFVAPGDAGEAVARVIQELEAGGTDADVLLGIADTQVPKALARGLFEPYDPALIPNLANVPGELIFDETGHVVPFDHGYITLVYDSERIDPSEAPKTLEDLTDPKWRGQIIMMDPRTSSPGHAFLMWTIAKYGDPGFVKYWERLSPNLLTITGGWTEAYNYFLEGEAPIVVSYSTDTAYSVTVEGTDRQRVLTPEGEGYRQIEGMGIVRGTDQRELAHAFINYVLSVEAQEKIPPTNWMFPANRNAAVPENWEIYAVIPERPAYLAPEEIEANEARWLRLWATAISR